ncbi:hypothetical protein K461DRAFT_127145 [Myriangium duriaei CBS 260.36]|uniref:Uncharacterized protein n=1 Tax=Myriangium duriaei CBS 260.36 TaxID=1168546 RepID=A0A9P4MH40_9PEZI|nr:hypothetical protein K461DRAFT_127145 [Myriangium duriaei CBS 260.36]
MECGVGRRGGGVAGRWIRMAQGESRRVAPGANKNDRGLPCHVMYGSICAFMGEWRSVRKQMHTALGPEHRGNFLITIISASFFTVCYPAVVFDLSCALQPAPPPVCTPPPQRRPVNARFPPLWSPRPLHVKLGHTCESLPRSDRPSCILKQTVRNFDWCWCIVT